MKSDRNEIESALHDLPSNEYAPLLQIIRQVVLSNLQVGRVQKVLNRGNGRSLGDYVRQVAQVVRADYDILERLAQNEDAAWEDVYQILRVRAYLQLMRLGIDHLEAYDRANDFAQETCVTLLGANYPSDVPYLSWAKRILRNRVYQDVLRRPDLLDRKGLTLSFQSDEAEEQTQPEDSGDGDFTRAIESRHAFEWALAQLPSESQREVLRRELDGWTDEEIAEQTGKSIQAVYNLKHRAKREVRRLLGSQGLLGNEFGSR